MGEPHPRPPGVRRHAGRRDDHRPARPGLRDERGDGDGRGSPRGAVQPAGARGGRPPHLRPRRRRRPDGRRRARGRFARRPPRAREARRLLRLQPHLPGRLHEPVLHRRRRAGVRGVRMARREGGRRERPGGPRARDRHREGGDGQALPRDRENRDRLRQPEAGHVRRPRLAPQRRAGDRDEAQAGLPLRGALLPPRGGPPAPAGREDARPGGRGRVARALRGVPPGPPRARRRARARDGGRAAEGLGWGHPGLHDGRQADRHALGRREDHQRDRRPRAGAPRRLRRPQLLDGDRPQGGGRLPEPGDRRGRAPGRGRRRVGLRGEERPLRRARARDGGRLLRPRPPRRGDPVLGDVLHVRRLHAPGHPPRLAHEAPLDLRLHPRQHRGGRGRTDPPADRARGVAPRDPAPHGRSGRPTPTRRRPPGAWR